MEVTIGSPKGNWWWLSFGSTETGKWLGGCWVQAFTFSGALARSHELNINPGGEVKGQMLTPGQEPPASHKREVLLKKGDVELERM